MSDPRKQAALEVILAALAVREEDTAHEFPDSLHSELIDAAVRSVAQGPIEVVCHFGAWDATEHN